MSLSDKKSAVEPAYAFFHQKMQVYAYSTSETEKDHIEDVIASYVNTMSPELYSFLSGGSQDYLREHVTFQKDLADALKKMEQILGI